MENLLGLAGLVVFIVTVIAIAAAVTWVVVKITPTKDEPASTSSSS